EDRPARGPRPRNGHRHLGRAAQAGTDRRIESPSFRSDGAQSPADRQGPPAEALLRDAGRRRSAHVRLLRQRRGVGPLQLSPLSREPVARGVRLRRHAAPADLPRSQRSPAATAGRVTVRREGSRGGRRPPSARPPAVTAAAQRGRVAVIGAGAWGTTLARIIGRQEPILLVARSDEAARAIEHHRRNERRLPGVDLPGSLVATADPAAVSDAVDLVIVAVPSSHVRSAVSAVAPYIAPTADVVSVVKGLESNTLLRMSEVIAEASGIRPGRIAALSGPNLAIE